MKLQAKVVVQTQNRLGEGVVWSTLDRQLLWTDIFGRRSHGYDPVAIETEPFAFVDRLAWSATLGGDHIFARFAAGPGLFHLNGSAANDIVAIERGLPTIRIIDNKPDQRGRFTFGTMDEQPQAPCPTGSFRNFDDTLSLRKIFSSVRISSPIEFSTDRRQSYCTRTPSQCCPSSNALEQTWS